jgi:hypothetical protein
MLKNHIIKSEDPGRKHCLKLLCSLTDGDEAWQKKILEDKQITAALLPLFTIYEKEYVYWGLLLNISQHAG